MNSLIVRVTASDDHFPSLIKEGPGEIFTITDLSHRCKNPRNPPLPKGDLDLLTLPLSKGRDLSHIEKDRFILPLQPDIKMINRLAILFFASGNQCSTPALVFDGRQHRVGLIRWLIVKINSSISVHEHATRKDCHIDMRSLYGCVRTRDRPRLDRFE